jgi:hypothetical protein
MISGCDQMRLHIGMYSVFMREWLSVFPRSSFYLLRTEDYHDNMAQHLNAIFNFLGVGECTTMTMTFTRHLQATYDM